MLPRSAIYKLSHVLLATLIVGHGSVAQAEKSISTLPVISSQKPQFTEDDTRSTPNSSVVLDFTIQNGESWDARGRPNNITTNCFNGSTITGFEYTNVTIETFAGSFFSEAAIYFSDSSLGDDGVRIAIGANNNNPGIETFNSNGIIDISDVGISDVSSNNDGRFFMQFYEETDDISGVMDAKYTSGTLTVWGIDLVATRSCPFIESGGNEFADLNVDFSINPNSDDSIVGNVISYDIEITNNGDGPANNVRIDNQLSDKLRFENFTCDDGTEVSELPETTISINDISAGATVNCSLETRILGFGEINNSITVFADNDDNNSNNSATVTIMGAAVTIPVNSYWTLAILALLLLVFANRKQFKSI